MIMLFAHRDNLIALFPIWMLFVSFSCLNALVKTSRTVLNRSGKSRPPYPDADQAFPSHAGVSYGFAIYGLYSIEVLFLYI
jgi:hypothetical protein